MSLDLTSLRERTIVSEGKKPFFYLDTATPPRVTIGIGNAVTLGQALALKGLSVDGRPATPAEIAADYNRVAASTGGLRAEAYSHLSVCRMSEEAIVELFEGRVSEFETQLRALFPGYDAFPETARLGLIDLIFQAGSGNLRNHFPKFVRAVRATPPDWKTAAKESHRAESSAERNATTFAYFMHAAGG